MCVLFWQGKRSARLREAPARQAEAWLQRLPLRSVLSLPLSSRFARDTRATTAVEPAVSAAVHATRERTALANPPSVKTVVTLQRFNEAIAMALKSYRQITAGTVKSGSLAR